jgi:hypothetical protein
MDSRLPIRVIFPPSRRHDAPKQKEAIRSAHELSGVPTSPRSDSSILTALTAVYPSVYLNGAVDPQDTSCTLTSIVCHDWYSHFSPEVR